MSDHIYEVENNLDDEATHLWLCEASMLMLRPEQPYVFHVHPKCERCRIANEPFVNEQSDAIPESVEDTP